MLFAALAKAELAPLALDAYPEAYAEFKHSMLHLLHSPAQHNAGAEQPLACHNQDGMPGLFGVTEPAKASREQLAGMVFRTIRQALGEAVLPALCCACGSIPAAQQDIMQCFQRAHASMQRVPGATQLLQALFCADWRRKRCRCT